MWDRTLGDAAADVPRARAQQLADAVDGHNAPCFGLSVFAMPLLVEDRAVLNITGR